MEQFSDLKTYFRRTVFWLENCSSHLVRKKFGVGILQGIILHLEVEIIMQMIGRHCKGPQDFKRPQDLNIISVLKAWMHSQDWLPLSACCLILVIYKQLKLFAFFWLVQAFHDLLRHRVGTRFYLSSLAHGPLMTEDLGLLPDIRVHFLFDMGRKIFCISVSSDIYTINLCLKYALQMSKKKTRSI